MSFEDVYAKSQESVFRQRLTVAVVRQCQFALQTARASWPGGAPSEELYAWRQDLARVLRSQVQIPAQLTQIAIYALLPWGSIDPDDDTELQDRIGEVFDELAGGAPPE